MISCAEQFPPSLYPRPLFLKVHGKLQAMCRECGGEVDAKEVKFSERKPAYYFCKCKACKYLTFATAEEWKIGMCILDSGIANGPAPALVAASTLPQVV
jgi:hypothetical protein